MCAVLRKNSDLSFNELLGFGSAIIDIEKISLGETVHTSAMICARTMRTNYGKTSNVKTTLADWHLAAIMAPDQTKSRRFYTSKARTTKRVCSFKEWKPHT
jgi:hypothetical protein